jgi:hypothetical protein
MMGIACRANQIEAKRVARDVAARQSGVSVAWQEIKAGGFGATLPKIGEGAATYHL